MPRPKRTFRALSEVSRPAAAMLPVEDATLSLLEARVPAARGGGLKVRRSGDTLLLATQDKNVRHQVDALEGDLIRWLSPRFPEVRRIRWTMA